jgi:hypothetical protein
MLLQFDVSDVRDSAAEGAASVATVRSAIAGKSAQLLYALRRSLNRRRFAMMPTNQVHTVTQ